MPPTPFNSKMNSLFRIFSIIPALGWFMLLGGVGDCLGEVLAFRNPPSHGVRSERIVGDNLHELDPLNHKCLERGDLDCHPVSLGGGLGELHAVVEVGHGDLHSEITEMPAFSGFGCSIGGGGRNPAADYDTGDSAGRSDNSDQRGDDECLGMCVHVLLWGLGSGIVGIAFASIWISLRLGLLPLPDTVIRYARKITGKREIIANDTSTAREAAEANAADTPIDGEEDGSGWLKVSPFGTFRGSVPGRQQVFGTAEANAIVAEFNSVRGRLGRLFRGAPIFIGHPDQSPDLYTDHRRLGKIMQLQSRADGLWAEVEWNALGRENLQEGYWVYPSPRWDAPAGRKEFRPDRLISIGLTNSPRIPTSEPVTNSEDSIQNPKSNIQNSPNTTPTTDMDRKLITEKLGLDVTATDEEILAKLAGLMSAEADGATALRTAEADAAAAKSEKDTMACSLDAERLRANQAETALTATREAHANALLDTAQSAGRITPADRAAWLPRLTGENREAEANTLAAIPPRLNTTPLDLNRSKGEVGDEKARRETISNAVDARMAKGMSYHEAWNDAKRDPALQSTFAAMTTPA